jgi:preprotein translocase subunit SecD
MEKSWYWRLTLVLGLVVFAVYNAIPSLIYFQAEPECRRSRKCLEELIPTNLPDTRVNFGIDLQGGLHLVMGVDAPKAVQNRTDRVGDEIVASMEDKGKNLKGVKRLTEAPELEILLESSDDYETLKEILAYRDATWEVRSHTGDRVVYGMQETYEEQLLTDAVDQAIKTLRNRIDKYGVTEPEVRKRGNDSILIQIAGLTADDEKRVKEEIIGKTAQLEFKLADDGNDHFNKVAEKGLPDGVELQNDQFRGEADTLVTSPYLVGPSKLALQEAVAKLAPPADVVVRYQRLSANKPGEDSRWRTWLLKRKTPLTGDSLVSAYVNFNSEENQYEVSMKLDRAGASVFEKFTGDNIKKRMAIVLDDIVDSAPVIQSRIPNGNVRITLGGVGSNQERLQNARDLSLVLNAGALPAPVYPQEQRTVGATLGDDAVVKGKQALIAAAVLMVLIMMVYYRMSGVIAVIALSMNMLFLFAALAAFNATLTLPGMAGLALTIGMAVDANIIQFERIREEMRLGKTARAAVDAGFDKAFSAIFDANVTTALACIVLLEYGSGPIRGFATTLLMGVVINTFSAIVIPRLCLDYLTRSRRIQELSI